MRFLAVVLVGLFLISCKQETQYSSFNYDDETKEVIANAIIPEHSWVSYIRSLPANKNNYASHIKRTSDSSYFLDEYVRRSNGVPPLSVISKWPKNKRIYVSNRWGAFSSQRHDKLGYGHEVTSKFPREKMSDLVVGRIVQEIAPIVKEVTDLELEYFSYSSFTPEHKGYKEWKEKGKSPLQDDIRIIISFNDSHKFTNNQKMRRDSAFEGIVHGPASIPFRLERFFVGAIPFTAVSNISTDGYFLTDHKNNIRRSACYINAAPMQKVEIDLRIKECLLRSLGIPNEIILKDNKSVLAGDFDLEREQSTILTDFEKSLLRVLYDDRLKPGDSYSQIHSLLRK